jgi:hypothetical protein
LQESLRDDVRDIKLNLQKNDNTLKEEATNWRSHTELLLKEQGDRHNQDNTRLVDMLMKLVISDAKTPAPSVSSVTASPPDVKTPIVATQTPVMTTQAPVVAVPAPSVTVPAPAVSVPAPSVTVPAPAVSVPAPSVTFPAPAVTLPTPAVTVPAPVVTASAPVVAAPPPVVATPSPFASAGGSLFGGAGPKGVRLKYKLLN